MLKLFNKYSKAPLVNMMNKEGLHQGSATYSTVYVVYLVVALIWRFGESRKYCKLNVCHLGCKHGLFHTVLKIAK